MLTFSSKGFNHVSQLLLYMGSSCTNAVLDYVDVRNFRLYMKESSENGSKQI